VAAAKAEHYQELYTRLRRPEGANEIYRLARSRQSAAKDVGLVMHVKDDQGNLLRRPEQILRQWHDHYEKICNEEFPHPPIPEADPVLGPVERITPGEVEVAVRAMKNGKVTGPDDIPAEVWKIVGQESYEYLASLFNKCLEDGQLPSDWRTSVTVPIWKGKGDVTDCSNYRPIRLLCHTFKIMERVINTRLRAVVRVSGNQCGFVKGSGTTDAIHAVRIMMEKYREKQRPINVAFLDLEKAFDRVPHDLIWYSLR
jgi:hypothetical protein